MKTILRSILRDKLSSGVIFISLITGLACINLIALFINYELNTDSFHADSKQIYTLQADHPFGEGKIYQCRFGSAEYMKDNFTEIVDFCRISTSGSSKLIVNNDVYFDKPRIMASSENFFSFFSFELLANNRKTVLKTPNSLVISDVLAQKYFGYNDAIGQSICFLKDGNKEDMIVTGVFKKPIQNTQFNFDIVRALGKEEMDTYCCVRLKRGASVSEVEKIFKANQAFIPIIYADTPGTHYLKPFRDTYFDTTEKSGIWQSRNKGELWIAFVVAFLIFVIASFNYFGLSRNKLIERSKEFTIRRINGGSKFRLLQVFMSEASFLIGVSFLGSLFLMMWIAPFFNKLVKTHITRELLFQMDQILLLSSVCILLFIITLLFTFYRIQSKLKSNFTGLEKTIKSKRINLPIFSILQLATTVILIICSFFILKQIHFISDKPIGLDKSVIEVRLPVQYAKQVSILRDELKKNPFINDVSIATASPVLEHYIVFLEYQKNGIQHKYTPAIFEGDDRYINTLGIKLSRGTAFSGNPVADKKKCLINESLADRFPEINLIGRSIPGGVKDQIVIGIVKDFHYSSLKSVVQPAMIKYKNTGFHLLVKPIDERQAQTQEAIFQAWNKFIPDYPLNIESIGDRFEWYHRENNNYVKLLGACCIISILLSMISLFANSYKTTRYRTKEIGIRKVNGAKTYEIIKMLNKEFAKWVTIAFIIACPIAYYAMSKWLENFAYKTELSWWIFALSGIIALGIALLTVSFQSWRAATRNPVESLRYE
ncbi:hypothetical protein BZG02_12840 [Labilibaculum filiforme]|uniref:Uncharacterized protein n=1 Tax=Labilibaculum filiforme TaxID=1940526 RepID=A0A2N3HX44_9BACT|nr:ABC transporter permease [Labilibaculum filiforme]PKQ62598.1 hypothetical protein BZG02_12840 [Labilibaculum filiforme]